MNVITLYVTYTILIGLLNLVYLLGFNTKGLKEIKRFTHADWTVVGLLCVTYFVAYISHFIAIQSATNPGYANALVMFHVVVLITLSTYFLNKPLNTKAMYGIVIMFIGSYLVVTNA